MRPSAGGEPLHYAYLHGFASGPHSYKGGLLARALGEHGVHLHRPDLNVPSFERLTVTGSLAAIDAVDRAVAAGGGRWRLIGSSMGGYLAALWAAANPGRVDSLVLLCPGFGITERWPKLLGEEAMAAWKRRGTIDWPDGEGRVRPLHWAFVEDARRYPPEPEVPCPTLILHGTRDDVVPVETSRRYAASRPHVSLVELPDGHALLDVEGEVVAWTLRFFGLSPSTGGVR